MWITALNDIWKLDSSTEKSLEGICNNTKENSLMWSSYKIWLLTVVKLLMNSYVSSLDMSGRTRESEQNI